MEPRFPRIGSAFAIGTALVAMSACGSDEHAAFDDGESCNVDTDCKGDRICEDGACVDPDGTGGLGAGNNGGTGAVGAAPTVHPCGPPSGTGAPPPGSGADTTAPTVTCIGFDKANYAAGESGFIEYLAVDDVSGITDFEGGCWSVESATGNSDISVCGTVEPLGGDLYRIPFDVGAFVENGEFFLSRATIHDLAGNGFELDAAFTDETYEGTSISVARTSVGGSSTDTTPPVVTQVAFESSSYAKGATGYVQYRATDDLSGITDFEGGCWTISNASGASTLSACGTVEPLGDDLYRLPFDVDAFAASGPYFLVYASVHDLAGNATSLSAEVTDSVYRGTSIAVATTTIQ